MGRPEPIAWAAALLLAACGGPSAAGGGAAAPSDTGAPKAGSQATDFSARDIEGRTVRLSDYLGKQAVLLDFWSTFCQPCLAEMPHLNRIYQENKAKGFVVLGVSMDGPETVADVPAFAKRNGVTFPIVLDEDSRVAAIYNPRKSAPLSVLIDKSGHIAVIREGYNPGDEELVAKDVARVLDGGGAAN